MNEMEDRFQELADFSERLHNASCNEDLIVALTKEVERFAVTSFIYAFAPTYGSSEMEYLNVDTLPSEWMERYLSEGLFNTDYAAWWCSKTSDPLRWSAFWRSVKSGLVEDRFHPTHYASLDHGVSKGVTIPISSSAGTMAGLSFVSDNAERETAVDRMLDDRLPYLQLCAELFHARVSIGSLAKRRFRITQQRLDVILYLADGLQQDEIAHRLGISVQRVRVIIRECKDLLGASTTAQMVGKAKFLELV